MRSVEEQQTRVTAAAVALPSRFGSPSRRRRGLLCAEEVVTERPLPGFDQAAIDGYAVRSVDVAGAGADLRGEDGEPTDLTLPVVGEVTAGLTPTDPGCNRVRAVRVDTGRARCPRWPRRRAPARKHRRWSRSRVRIFEPVRSGDYVRRAGDDVQPGDVAVRAGTIIGAAQVGLLAAVGRDKVLVHPRPAPLRHQRRWRTRRRGSHAGTWSGLRRQFVCPRRRSARCRRRRQPCGNRRGNDSRPSSRSSRGDS